MPLLLSDTDPEFFGLSHPLRKHAFQLQTPPIGSPVHRFGRSASQRVAASCTPGSDVAPVHIAQIGKVQTSCRQRFFLERTRTVPGTPRGQSWSSQLSSFQIPTNL